MNLVGSLRGGAAVTGAAATATTSSSASAICKYVHALGNTPTSLFNALLIAILGATFSVKLFDKLMVQKDETTTTTVDVDAIADMPQEIDGGKWGLMKRYLPVFWLLRCADWLQGPYFYEVYASKMFNGQAASLSLISRLFLTGFASTAAFGPLMGRLTDSRGRRKGTICFTLLYTLGALSTKSPLLTVLLLGRLASGIGTSLLFSAPEAWLVADAQRTKQEGALGEIFGLVS
jgi:hypothetical protein